MSKGFTLIEITIAIFVLTIGIVGVYSLVPQIVATTAINTNKFIASQLAREGVEIVRNIRDTNWLQDQAWDNGLTNCSAGCEIDYDDSGLNPYQGLYLKTDGQGFYNYQIGDRTRFKRKIIIQPDRDFLDIDVEVSWSGKYSPFKVEEKLYNWY